jgi:hypothetical protein
MDTLSFSLFPEHQFPLRLRNSATLQKTNGTAEAFPFGDHEAARIFGARGRLLATCWQSEKG